MKDKLIKLLAEQYGVVADTITNDTDILSLGADSLDLVETRVLIENEFNIDIETNEFVENTTVSGLIGLIGSKI
jgi:acyl carrier protein